MLTRELMDYRSTDPKVDWAEMAVTDDDAWSPPPKDTVATWAPGKAQWLRIPVANTSAQAGDFQFEIRWAMFESVQLRVMRNGEFGIVHQAGIDHLQGPRAASLLPFSLQPGERATLYLRIEDPYFQYLPMFIWAAEDYAAHSQQRLVLFSIAVGVLAVMVLYNASLFLFTRDRMYLVYTNSVFSTLLIVLVITGIGQRLLWGESEWLVKNAYPVFSSYAFLSVTLFFRAFVGLRQHGGWVLKCNNLVLVFWVLVLLGNVSGFHQLAMGLASLGGLVANFLSLIISFYLWRQGNASAKYFCIAWTPVSVSSCYSILAIFALAPYVQVLDYALTYSFVIEVVVLSVALAERINRERLAREEAQALALEQQQWILELKENVNRELESQVERRTAQLRSALQALGRANTELSAMTKTDPLTGLSNRRHFDETLEAEAARAARLGRPLSLLIVDIDHFKSINDTFGHLVGDECLKLIGDGIRRVVGRETDTVSRYGGEEFAVILPATTEADGLLVAERVRQAIADIGFSHEGQPIPTTGSIGLASDPPGCIRPVKELVDAADKALYMAKQNGRNRTEVAPPDKAAVLEAQVP